MENKQTFFEQQPVVREPGLLDVHQQQPDVAPVKKPKYRWMWLVFTVVFIGVLAAILVNFQRRSNNNGDSSAKTQDINLSSVSPSAVTFTMKENDRVVFNGQLQANEGIVLSPTQETPTSVIGQIYLDNTTNQIRYYNGTGYLSLAVDDGQLCKNNNPNCGFLNDAAIANLVTQAQATGLIQNAINGLVIPALPQDLATSASPQFAGLKLKNGGGGIVTLQSSASSASLTFTLPVADGALDECLVTNGAGQLSFSSCSTGSGTAFVQGGNSFGATATLGTNDSNPLVFRTNGITQATLAVGGALTLQNSINSTSALNVLNSTSATVFNVDTTNGRVGIGTATPQTKLSVVNTSLVAQTAFKVNQENTAQYIAEFRSNDTNVFTLGGSGAALFQNPTDMVDAFRVNDDSGAAVLAVNNTWGTLGAVGIGTNGPTAKLSVIGIGNATGDALRVSNSTSTGNIAIFADDTTTVATIANGGAVILQNSVDSTTGFQVLDVDGGTSVLNVDTTNERVGIGTDSPSYRLDVSHSSTSTTGTGPWASEIAARISFDDTGVVTSGTDNTVGLNVSTTRTGATGGTISTIGGSFTTIGDDGGTSTATGLLGQAYLADSNIGIQGQALVSGSNNQTSAVGVKGQVLTFGASGNTVDEAYALQGYIAIDIGASTFTKAAGLNILSATNTAGGTITDNYGIIVNPQTIGTNDYGVAIGAADTQTLWLSSNADNTTAAAGIALGSSRDTNLYRSAANTLRTDDVLSVGTLSSYDVDDSYALCREASGGRLTPCDSGNPNARPFLQGGNTFGATATLGTNDAYGLSLETQNLTQATLAVGGAMTFQNTTDSTSGFRVMDQDGGTPILNVDTTNERVGIGTAAPTEKLQVTNGSILQNIDSSYTMVISDTISNTDNSSLLGSQDVYVVGDFAYALSDTSDRINILDISNPSNIQLISSLNDATNLNNCKEIEVRGNYAYVVCATPGNRITVIDIKNPKVPTVLGSLQDNTNFDDAKGIDVQGKYAFIVSEATDAISVVDISNPSNPVRLSTLIDGTNLNGAKGVDVVGDYAYVASRIADSLSVINIANPASMSVAGSVSNATTLNGANKVTVAGKYAYISASFDDRLVIVDVEDPSTPAIEGSVQDATNLDDIQMVTVVGNYVFASAATPNRVTAIDISNPASPSVVTSLQDNTLLSSVQELFVAGKYLYFAADGAGASGHVGAIKLPGVEAINGVFGAISVTQLEITQNLVVQANANFSSGLNVGLAGANIQGDLSVGGYAVLQNSVDSTTGFQVLDTDGGTPILNVDTTNERVGIGNAAPTVALDVTGAGQFSTYMDVGNSIAIGNGATGGADSIANIGLVHTFNAANVTSCGFGCYGVIADVTADNPASANSLAAYYAKTSTAASSFTLTSAYGLYVNSAGLGAGSTITNNFGIRVLAQTAGASDYGIAVEAADTQTLWLSSNADNTSATAGIAFGLSRDTNLYRSAANTLKTDDNLLIQTATNSTAAFQVQNSAGSAIFNVDTSNSKVGTPDTATASTNSNAFVLQSGNASGTTSNSGNVTIDVGTATGTLGVINIGTTNALTVTIGKSGATLTVDSNATFNGTLTVGGHVISANTSGTTTIAAGAAACTTPTVMTVTGNDTAGLISVTTGTGCAATGTLATVTFANTYGAAPRVILTPTNAGATGLTYYNGSANATTFTLDTNTVPVDATSYTYNYFVIK